MARLADLVTCSAAVAGEHARHAKIARMAEYLRGLDQVDGPFGACLLAGELPQGRVGVGPVQIRAATATSPAAVATLTLGDLETTLMQLVRIRGAGAQVRRGAALDALFVQATPSEQAFLARLLLGELHQGATAGLLVEALALAARVPPGAVRRALMLSGNLMRVAETALVKGAAGLAEIGLTLFRPIQPMLAQPAADLDDALARLAEPVLEYKLDGARIQVHKRGEDVRVYSRQGNEVTDAVPEIVDRMAPLPAADLVLDGEVLALRPSGCPHPFQTTMRRFGRRLDVESLRSDLPLTPFFFDCIQLSGQLLVDAPARERFAALVEAVPPETLIPRLERPGRRAAADFLARAFEAGHEGLMAKSADAPYEAGGRGANWLKIKQAHSLDLVVLAAEWGNGRRVPWLSNLHLGARAGADPSSGFVMLGKTFKGLTDAMLAWQTERLLSLALTREGHIVRVRPELVVEVAFNELQESPHYPAGLALRFARVKRFRPDKSAAEADDMEKVRALFERQLAYRAA